MEGNADLLKLREMKKRKVTRYDAEMIIQASQHSQEPPSSSSPTKAGSAPQAGTPVPPAAGDSVSPSKAAAQLGNNICTDLFCGTDSSSGLSASAPQPPGGKTVCNLSNPCASRQRGKRTLSQTSRSSHKRSRLGSQAETGDENQPVVGEEALSELESAESRTALWTGKNSHDPGLDLATGSTTVRGIPFSSRRNSAHAPPQGSFPQQPNGRLPCSPLWKGRVRRAEPLRQSPRLRPRHLPGQQPVVVHHGHGSCPEGLGGACVNGGGVDLGEHPPLDSDLDNDDSGLGEMTGDVFDKSLDSNHNFHHDPPVLEREVPYVPADARSASFCAFPNGEEESSDQEANKSSSSVPQLPFCGPAPSSNKASHDDCAPHVKSPPRGRQKRLHIKIKLKHPNHHRLLDFNQQLERDGKSQFVLIEPKEPHSVNKAAGLSSPQASRLGFEFQPARPVAGATGPVFDPARGSAARPVSDPVFDPAQLVAGPGAEPIQPPVRLRLRSDKAGKIFQCLSPKRTASVSLS